MHPKQNCPDCGKPATLTNLKRSYLRVCPKCHLRRTRPADAAAFEASLAATVQVTP